MQHHQERRNMPQKLRKAAGLNAGDALSLPQREKYWSEIDTDEKIERLRAFVKNLQGENNRLRSTINSIKQHTHDDQGKAVTVKPLTDEYGEYGGNQIGTRTDQPWTDGRPISPPCARAARRRRPGRRGPGASARCDRAGRDERPGSRRRAPHRCRSERTGRPLRAARASAR